MNEYTEIRLGNVVDVTSSKRIFLSDYVPSGIPFYRSKEIIEKSLKQPVSTELYISHDKYAEIKQKYGSPKDGDILIAAVGERAGIPYRVNADGEFYFKDGNLIWLRNFPKSLSSSYLLHYLKSDVGQRKLESTFIGSAQKALTIVGIKSLDVPVPPLPEQQAIAEVLSSLDDKIDLLHRNNKTLEQLAETLFRQWFVEEADSQIISLGEVANFFNGKVRPIESGTVPVYGGNGILGYTLNWNYEGKSIIIGRVGAYCGSLFFEDGNIWVSDNALLVRPKITGQTLYLYYLLKTLNLNDMAQGSSHPLLTQTLLRSIEISKGDDERISKFEEYAAIWMEKSKKNMVQIRQLESLRDTLLPKLMSGAVRVTM